MKFAQELMRVGDKVLDVDAEEDDPASMRLGGGVEVGRLVPARHAPGGPKVDHNRVAAEFVQGDDTVVERGPKRHRPVFGVGPDDTEPEGGCDRAPTVLDRGDELSAALVVHDLPDEQTKQASNHAER